MPINRLPGIDFVLAKSLHLFTIVFPATSITKEKYGQTWITINLNN